MTEHIRCGTYCRVCNHRVIENACHNYPMWYLHHGHITHETTRNHHHYFMWLWWRESRAEHQCSGRTTRKTTLNSWHSIEFSEWWESCMWGARSVHECSMSLRSLRWTIMENLSRVCFSDCDSYNTYDYPHPSILLYVSVTEGIILTRETTQIHSRLFEYSGWRESRVTHVSITRRSNT